MGGGGEGEVKKLEVGRERRVSYGGRGRGDV